MALKGKKLPRSLQWLSFPTASLEWRPFQSSGRLCCPLMSSSLTSFAHVELLVISFPRMLPSLTLFALKFSFFLSDALGVMASLHTIIKVAFTTGSHHLQSPSENMLDLCTNEPNSNLPSLGRCTEGHLTPVHPHTFHPHIKLCWIYKIESHFMVKDYWRKFQQLFSLPIPKVTYEVVVCGEGILF